MAAGEVDELFGSLDDGAAFETHPLEPARNRSGSVVTGAQLARTAQRALGHLGFEVYGAANEDSSTLARSGPASVRE